MAFDTLLEMADKAGDSRFILKLAEYHSTGARVTRENIEPTFHVVCMCETLMKLDLSYDEAEFIHTFIMHNFWPVGINVEMVRQELHEQPAS